MRMLMLLSMMMAMHFMYRMMLMSATRMAALKTMLVVMALMSRSRKTTMRPPKLRKVATRTHQPPVTPTTILRSLRCCTEATCRSATAPRHSCESPLSVTTSQSPCWQTRPGELTLSDWSRPPVTKNYWLNCRTLCVFSTSFHQYPTLPHLIAPRKKTRREAQDPHLDFVRTSLIT